MKEQHAHLAATIQKAAALLPGWEHQSGTSVEEATAYIEHIHEIRANTTEQDILDDFDDNFNEIIACMTLDLAKHLGWEEGKAADKLRNAQDYLVDIFGRNRSPMSFHKKS